jgi:hypothetical protein
MELDYLLNLQRRRKILVRERLFGGEGKVDYKRGGTKSETLKHNTATLTVMLFAVYSVAFITFLPTRWGFNFQHNESLAL